MGVAKNLLNNFSTIFFHLDATIIWNLEKLEWNRKIDLKTLLWLEKQNNDLIYLLLFINQLSRINRYFCTVVFIRFPGKYNKYVL